MTALTLDRAQHLQATRRDVLRSQQVEVGIVYQKMLSNVAAAEYLFAHNVPLHVALRILLCPGKRRTFCSAPERDVGLSQTCQAEAEAQRLIRRLTQQAT
ncbi:hypothetical protein [Massilia sp. Root351]|uniref:hypothetical protein n=1 Tax=Massilia sp. Root351 TaxID=1736522 RepID=UPI0012F6A42D|nr:hypothetical protein [Massilia sp. Root351]